VAIGSYIFTFGLLAKLKFSHDGITNETCHVGQLRILTPLWKVPSSFVQMPLCGVQFWIVR